MLRQQHIYMKGGLWTFAALCREVCCAGLCSHSPPRFDSLLLAKIAELPALDLRKATAFPF
jgi:hypothetical protein